MEKQESGPNRDKLYRSQVIFYYSLVRVRFASQTTSFLTVGDLENVAVWPGLGNMRIAAALLHNKVEISPRGAREKIAPFS